jgi:hypothetical protein
MWSFIISLALVFMRTTLQTVRKSITILVRLRMAKNSHRDLILTVSNFVENLASQMASLTVSLARHGSVTA